VICASQIYWTLEVHEAIRAGPHGLTEYQEKLTKQVIPVHYEIKVTPPTYYKVLIKVFLK